LISNHSLLACGKPKTRFPTGPTGPASTVFLYLIFMKNCLDNGVHCTSTLSALLLEITQEQFSDQLSSSPDVLLAIMRTLSDRARDNLKIFKNQESLRDRTHKVKSEDKLEEHVKYLMQEAGLTSREADVARLICDGLSDKEIAGRLGLSHHTVKDYLKRIYAKFRVHARAQLVSLMFK
jgi:DNA-binding CsgD family transcriptional regulator